MNNENEKIEDRKDISYLAFESSQARMERINNKQWVIIIILIVLLFGSNAAWIYYESQWQYVQSTTTIEATQDGSNNIVGNGDITYGTESKDE